MNKENEHNITTCSLCGLKYCGVCQENNEQELKCPHCNYTTDWE